MLTVSAPQELLDAEAHVDLRALVGRRFYLKFESFNYSGSKIRSVAAMASAVARDGRLDRSPGLIESTSGNLAIAPRISSAIRGLRFVSERMRAVTRLRSA